MRGIQVPVATTLCGTFDRATNLVRDLAGKQLRAPGRLSRKQKARGMRKPQNLLSTGNETDRKEAYREFRGRDPEVKYILKKRGLPGTG